MSEDFTPITLKRADEFYRYWDATPRRSLDYSLVNLWGWEAYYGLQWSFDNDLCWIRQTVNRGQYPLDGEYPTEAINWAPVGNWNRTDWAELLKPGMQFIRVPEELWKMWAEQLGERIEVQEERGQWEYLYLQSDLATLKGRKFHKKAGHLRAFIREYGEPDYRPLDDRMVEDCLALQDTWCQWHNCEGSPSLKAENEAINRVLAHYEPFRNLCGGAIYKDNEIIAFTVGEKLDDESVGVHFEKGLTAIKGVYQAINQAFSSRQPEGITYLNRAQDLDEEGLRKAKMSYNPADFLRKYKVTIN